MKIIQSALFAVATAFLLSGCISAPQSGLSHGFAPQSPRDTAKQFVQIIAEHCDIMAKEQGVNFSTCFESRTTGLMQKIEQQTLSSAEGAGSKVISSSGEQIHYVKRAYPGSDGLSADEIALAKSNGTYEELRKTVFVDQDFVWVGTKILKNGSSCSAETRSIESMPELTFTPREPAMKVVTEKIGCPAE